MTNTTRTNRTRGTSITGDLFVIEHPTLALDQPFTSHVDVSFEGVTHQILSTANRSAFNYSNTTGEFAIGDMTGHVIETMDTVETQVAHRYQAVISGTDGALATQSYVSADTALSLIAALHPASTALGIAIEPDDAVEITGPARVALTTDLGVLEITPLTATVNDQLPGWTGTAVTHGELFAGRLSDDVPYLVLVTSTCRVMLMLGADVSADQAATAMAELDATWTS